MKSERELKKEVVEEAFWIANELPAGRQYTWDFISGDIFGIEVPNKSLKDKYNTYLFERNGMLRSVNDMAQEYNAGWKLYVFEARKTVVKLEEHDMVRREIRDRFKRVAGAIDLMPRKLRPMITMPGVPENDIAIIERVIDLSAGVKMSLAGMVGALQSIDAKDKKELIALILPDLSKIA